jgi:chemotaxis protein MotB
LAEEVEAEIEEEEEECPKCPPVGAPAWMATFADMATLLMAFFVLILSFAEFNVPKFKQISGSLKNAFGVQRLIPVVEQPKGTTVLSLNFSPSPSPSVTRQMTQQTTNLEKKELEVKTKEDEGGEQDKSAKELVEALQEAVDKGEIKVEAVGEAVKVEIND